MLRTVIRLAAFACAAGLALVACARQRPAGGPIAHPRGDDNLVVRMGSYGGLLPPGIGDRAAPELSIYGSGRMIQPGPQIAIYPPPALPNLLERDLTEDAVQRVLRAAREAGLRGADRRLEHPGVADAPWARFVVVAAGERHRTEVYALGLGTPGEPDRAERRRLERFAEKLRTLDGWLPKGSVGPEREYGFEALRVVVRPVATVPTQDGVEQQSRDWPLSTPLAELGDAQREPGVRCGVVRGDDLRALVDAVKQSNALTRWRSGGEEFVLGVRPLLPDESGC